MVNESGELGMVQKQDQQEELLQDELGQSQMVACGGRRKLREGGHPVSTSSRLTPRLHTWALECDHIISRLIIRTL